MAMIIGAAGRHALDRATRAFQRMFLTTGLVLVAVGVFEGIVFSSLLGRGFLANLTQIVALPAGALVIWWLCQSQNRRIEQFERERANWRKGGAGELSVVETLKGLPDSFFVINGLKTKTGDLDHVVIGPTGLFFIETKNWREVVGTDGNGELLWNGRAPSKPAVRSFLARCMTVREQLACLTHDDGLRFRAVMVFPVSKVDAPFGKTGPVHCMPDECLCDYVENADYSQKLAKDQVEKLRRALEGIARMEPGFGRQVYNRVPPQPRRLKGPSRTVSAINQSFAR